jgi:hypothetical protein
MEIKVNGHTYLLDSFEDASKKQTLQFIHKVSTDTPGELKTIQDGTTNEEVLNVLINRMQYLNLLFPCRENSLVITKLEEALMWLEKRTRDRIKRQVEGKHIQ